MAYAKTSLRAEQRALRERMRAQGMGTGQIALEFARHFKLRPRAAWRIAYGWSLTDAAEQINVYAASNGLSSGGTVAMTAAHLCEHENWPGQGPRPTGRKPGPYLLSLLAAVYNCTIQDLLDTADYKHMPAADRLILDKADPGLPVAGSAVGNSATANGERAQLLAPPHDRSGPETAIGAPEPRLDTIVLNLHFDSNKMAVPMNRLTLLQAGASPFVEAFALGQKLDMIRDLVQHPGQAERFTVASPAHLQEILTHLREQWHALVKTDNLLGPRFALAGVLTQISVVAALRSVLRDEQRIEVIRLGARYAESAAWLYEDTGNMTQARSWTSQAMEWAYEGNEECMLAWTMFRRAQQAAAIPDAAQTIGLAQAARRNEEELATPARAAIRVQEAYGHALDGNELTAQRLLDEAHKWAAGDTVGDAREGHGSYCIPDYIEIQRATCWLATGQPKKAISLFEGNLRTLPTVYQRNHATTLARLATAYAADSQPEQAAATAHAALPVARSAGSMRIIEEIKNLGTGLIPYRALPAVAALLDELEAENHVNQFLHA